MASDSKAKGPEEATSEGEDSSKGKAIVGQHENLSAPLGGPKTHEIPVLPSNQNTSELIEGKSSNLQTEAPKTNNISVTSAGGLKLRVSVSQAGKRPRPVTGHAPSAGTLSPASAQALARLPTHFPKSANYLFGSCFGSPTKSSTSPLSQAPALQGPPRKQTPPSPTRRPADPQKTAAEVPPTTPPEKKADVLEPTSAKPAAEVAVATDSPVTTAPILARAPSCRCDIPIAQSEIAGLPIPSDAVATAGGPASMSKGENDPSTSSAQLQNLNAPANELIAAVKQANEERQVDAEFNHIRGLRTPRRQVRPQRQDNNAGSGDPRASPSAPPSGDGDSSSNPTRRRRLQVKFEPRAPNNNYRDDGRVILEKPPRRPHHTTTPLPDRDTRGIARLFDAILGRFSQSDAAALLPGGREIGRGRDVDVIMRDAHLPSACARVEQQSAREQEIGDDRQLQSARYPTWNSTVDPSIRLDSGYSSRQDAGASSSRQHGEYTDFASVPGPSDRDQYSTSENRSTDQTGRRGQMDERDPYAQERARVIAHQQERDAQLLASNYTFHLKDPYREVYERTVPKEPRKRGHPDPSFSPRPGDIIIRARKRAGLRLTDFYYYDNENYLEQGDQILRAKFDYLPPARMMYLWCRLYVYGADGNFTFLDSNFDKLEHFEKHFKDPAGFKGKP